MKPMVSIKRITTVLVLLSFFTISSCSSDKPPKKQEEDKEEKSESDNIVSEADKIVYNFNDKSVAPQYHRSYSIAVTENNLHFVIDSYGDTLLAKARPFTKEKFEEVKDRLKNVKQDGEIDDGEIPNGGTSESIAFYKKGKEIFSGIDYGRTKNFSGADIDLSYLIPDLKELVASTESRDN